MNDQGRADLEKRITQLEDACANIRMLAFVQADIAVRRFWADELAKPRYADPKRLLRYGFRTFSQTDEDGIIQEIFRRIGTTNKTFVEFGVETASECNTVKLLVEGWRGLWIEASSAYVVEIGRNFGSFVSDGRLAVLQSFVTAENINQLLANGNSAGEIDLLSIDIDNNDYWVWKAISGIMPRVVVIEYNADLRPPLSLVVPYDPARRWDGSNYFGASLEALVGLGKSKGYRIVGCNFSGVNAFFVREDVCGDHFLEPATAEEHFEPQRYLVGTIKSGHRGRPGQYQSVQ